METKFKNQIIKKNIYKKMSKKAHFLSFFNFYLIFLIRFYDYLKHCLIFYLHRNYVKFLA